MKSTPAFRPLLRAALCAWALLHTAAFAQTLKIGDPAPPIDAMAWLKGEPVSAFAKGHVYVVEFWATWCAPCKANIPHLTELARKYRGRATIIGVDVREREHTDGARTTVQRFVDQMGDKMDYTIAMDDPKEGRVFKTWMQGAMMQGIPTAFVVDREGRIAWVDHPNPSNHALEDAMKAALEGSIDYAAAREAQKKVVDREAGSREMAKFRAFLTDALERKDYASLRARAAELSAASDRNSRMMAGQLEYTAMVFLEPERTIEELRKGDRETFPQMFGVITSTRGVPRELIKAAIDVVASRPEPDLSTQLNLAQAWHAYGDDARAAAAIDQALIQLKSQPNPAPAFVEYLQRQRQEYTQAASRQP